MAAAARSALLLVAVVAWTGCFASSAAAECARPDPPPVVDPDLTPALVNISDWIMTLNLSSNNIPHSAWSVNDSIFINGNLARVLLAASKILAPSKTGPAAGYAAEALGWCRTLAALQQPIATSSGLSGGWWDTGYQELFIADTGTAVTTLVLCYHAPAASAADRQLFLEAMTRFYNFVVDGCQSAPAGGKFVGAVLYGQGCPPKGQGWVLPTGGLGDGYYKQALNVAPYTISTATSGSCFFAHYAVLAEEAKAQDQSVAAIGWLLRSRNASGAIPYIITPPDPQPHEFQAISYSTESFIANDLFFSAVVKDTLKSLNTTVDFLLRAQNADGSWGVLASGDGQRSPRAVSLLQWYYTRVQKDPAVLAGIRKYVAFVLDKWGPYQVNQNALVTGFVGLAFADLIQPWATFGPIPCHM